MKKITLFMAFAALGFTSCSSDDDKGTTPTLSRGYLEGVWQETAPDDMHILAFHGNAATLHRSFMTIGEYTYQISGNKLLLSAGGTTTPTEHTVTIVNDSVIKLSNFAIVGPAENGSTGGSMTFKKMDIIID